MIACTSYPDRGFMRITGTAPNGSAVLQRTNPGIVPQTIRGGAFNITTGGFLLEDGEAPFGIPTTYKLYDTITTRLIQRNMVLTPNFEHGVQSWVAGASRTFSIAGTTPNRYGAITSNPGGTGAGVPGRTIAEGNVQQLAVSTQYLITGRVRFSTPGVWLWQDVKNQGTWLNLRTTKASWDAVRSTTTGLGAGGVYNTLWVALSNGVTDYVAPVKVIDVAIDRVGEWFEFAAYVTTPGTIPSTAKLRLLHGTNTREYSVAWNIDKLQIKLATEAGLGPLYYMDGDTTLPARPQDNLLPDGGWEKEANDASIVWSGTVGASMSVYTAPSVISTSTTCILDPPEIDTPCEPVFLSDPVATSLGMWFGLELIDTLSRAARLSVFQALNRADPIAISQSRVWETGSLTLLTMTLEERERAWTLFSSGRALFYRNPDPLYPENLWYLACGDITEERLSPDHRKPERRFVVPFVRVAKPSGLITASSGVTWQQIRDNFATWSELRTERDDWLEVLTEPV